MPAGRGHYRVYPLAGGLNGLPTVDPVGDFDHEVPSTCVAALLSMDDNAPVLRDYSDREHAALLGPSDNRHRWPYPLLRRVILDLSPIRATLCR